MNNENYIAPEFVIAKLSKYWSCRDGLNYPLVITYNDRHIMFDTYEQHHEFIANLFGKQINK